MPSKLPSSPSSENVTPAVENAVVENAAPAAVPTPEKVKEISFDQFAEEVTQRLGAFENELGFIANDIRDAILRMLHGESHYLREMKKPLEDKNLSNFYFRISEGTSPNPDYPFLNFSVRLKERGTTTIEADLIRHKIKKIPEGMQPTTPEEISSLMKDRSQFRATARHRTRDKK